MADPKPHQGKLVFTLYSLNQTFMTLSLDDLASRVSLADAKEAERHLLEMVVFLNHLFQLTSDYGLLH